MNIVLTINLDDEQITNLEISVSEIEEQAKFAVLGALDAFKDGISRHSQAISYDVTSEQEW